MPLLTSLMAPFKQRWHRWRDRYLDKHLPSRPRIHFGQQQLFVFPTALGGIWLGLIALCYLLGTNYQNNLILLLAYWLLAVWLLAIVLAFRNLYQLELSSVTDIDGQAGQPMIVPLQLNRACQGLHLQYGDAAPVRLSTSTAMVLPALSRGSYPLARFKLWSEHPLGLIRCWTYPQLACQVWVYPQPQRLAELQTSASDQADSNDSIDGLRDYQPGDALRRVDWPRLARQQRLVVRDVGQATQHDPTLISATQCNEVLASHFAAVVLEAQATAQPIALQLPHCQLTYGNSREHYQQLLRALATWS